MESPLVVAQRTAIQEARTRYERGEITVEQLKRALDAISEAHQVSAVAAVTAGWPTPPHAALAAFEAPPPPSAPRPAGMQTVVSSGRGVSRISSLMSKTHRVGKPWTLAPRSRVSSTLGETVVDLRHAQLPPHGVMHVTVVMGETRILIPRSVRVSARTRVIMGGATTLGETVEGVVASGEEEYEPASGQPIADLEIDAWVIMGTLKIIVADLSDPSAMSIAELARATLREALQAARVWLAQGTTVQQPTLNPGEPDERRP
jgi:Cell wall-active antibiotics response 4TMS YvqF